MYVEFDAYNDMLVLEDGENIYLNFQSDYYFEIVKTLLPMFLL